MCSISFFRSFVPSLSAETFLIQKEHKSLIVYVISLQLLSFDTGENILNLKLGFILLCFTKSPNMIIQNVA